ncbi:MAG: DUF2076 domain-containing protein [Rhodovarius sp.]|nr:DUF2076 domain-containing protein [Rhodovarius sp.]MCX8132669.1 DUF2076 domain-containing protein [Roseococcus sp.]MDW8315738.1 DUF2076 domain-containing protein [Rhodovarius sp.]
MTEEERRIITEFVQRIAGAAPAPQQSGPWGGRTPSVAPRQPLPPIDPEADQLIQQLFQQYPEARYRITQTAFVQEHALVAAQNRIQELEWELEAARREAEAARNRGFFGFGGSKPAPMPPRPQPQFPPGYNPQALQGRQGPGFLGTALMTAAGVAGGIVLGNMIMNALGGGSAMAASGGAFGQEAVPTSSPWTDPGSAAGLAQPDATGAYEGGQDAHGAYDSGYEDEGYGDEEM